MPPAKTGENAFVEQPPHFARTRFQHDVAEGDLAVATEGDAFAAADGNDGGAVKGFAHAELLVVAGGMPAHVDPGDKPWRESARRIPVR